VSLAGSVASPRVAWVNGAQVLYSECASGCGGATPTFSSLDLGVSGLSPDEVSVAEADAGAVVALTGSYATGPVLAYRECGANCLSASSWLPWVTVDGQAALNAA